MRFTSLVIIAVPSICWAQPAPPPPPPPPLPAGSSAPTESVSTARLWVGPQLDLMPSGSVHLEINGMRGTADTSSAFGLGGLAEYRVMSRVAIGLAPRFVVPVQVENADDSGKQIDLRVRIAAGGDVGPRIRIHGLATVGYSWIMDLLALTDANGNLIRYQTTHGLIVGFGAGFQYTLNPRLAFTGEFSYQLGFQGTTVMDVDIAAGDDFLTLGFGLLAAVGR